MHTRVYVFGVIFQEREVSQNSIECDGPTVHLCVLMFHESCTPCGPAMVDFKCPTTWRMMNLKRFSCPKGKNFSVFLSIHMSFWRTNAKIFNCNNQGRINNGEIEMILNFDYLLFGYSISGNYMEFLSYKNNVMCKIMSAKFWRSFHPF